MNVLILGTGAQGWTVAQKLSKLKQVDNIICCDYDVSVVNLIAKHVKKVIPLKVDASNLQDILKIGDKYKIDLLVNALPLHFAKNCLEAALKFKCNYQDFAAGEQIKTDWLDGIKHMFSYYNKKFKAINKLAIIGTGSAPGLICLATRVAVRDLDKCDTIYNIVYEGVKAKQFLPFWFSPFTALCDMEEDAHAFINGKLVRTTPFSLPINRDYEELNKINRTFVEHAHDEPVYYGLNAKTLYKGLKNAYFKYGGLGIDFAMPLYQCGLLSRKPTTYKGQQIVPFDFVLKYIPNAPKSENEIKAILKNGILEDGGCMVIEAYGTKNNKKCLVELHVFAPGIFEAFKREKLTAEQYLTGQGGFIYTQMFVQNKYKEKGLISSDMLSETEIDEYFNLIKPLGIYYKKNIKSY